MALTFDLSPFEIQRHYGLMDTLETECDGNIFGRECLSATKQQHAYFVSLEEKNLYNSKLKAK